MKSFQCKLSWHRRGVFLGAMVMALLGFVLIGVRPASAQITYGTLSNFDVFDDTGQDCHGFEIELHGTTSADVIYKFGAPYNRYGDPVVVDFAGGVYVRYLSPYDPVKKVFTKTTVMAPPVITPTNGHACYAGGPVGNYDTSGCEHFGVSLRTNPTNTVYRWLIADPVNPGNLIASGTKVNIPAPIWNVALPPAPGVQPIVQAVLPAPPPEAFEFGDAQWVKVFVTESPAAVALHHLLTDDPAVPQDGIETEVEWQLLQSSLAGGVNNELVNEAQLGAGNESVTRRYEFYEYTGAYDPESHEALPIISDSNPDPSEIGNYIGAQMAALDLAPVPPPPPALVLAGTNRPTGEVGVPYNAALVSGGEPAYRFTVTGGAYPAGLSSYSISGMLSGTPTVAQNINFTVRITDRANQSVSGSFQSSIVGAVRITTSSLTSGKRKKAYNATLTAASGKSPFTWSVAAGTLPTGLTLNSSTGAISGVPTARAKSNLTFQVTDVLGGKAQKNLMLTIK